MLHTLPMTLVAVSMTRRVPASSQTGWGQGVRISQMPPSAVAQIRYRSSSLAPSPCQDWADTWTPTPRDRPRSYSCHSGTRPETAE
jgi:hypothetical protein